MVQMNFNCIVVISRLWNYKQFFAVEGTYECNAYTCSTLIFLFDYSCIWRQNFLWTKIDALTLTTSNYQQFVISMGIFKRLIWLSLSELSYAKVSIYIFVILRTKISFQSRTLQDKVIAIDSIKHKNMAGSTKLFQHLQKHYYHPMGIHMPQSNQRCVPNWRNLSTAFFLAQLFIGAFLFLLFEANSTFEYGTNFYTSISESCCLLYFYIQYCQMPNISKLIESCETFIESSK